MSFFRHTAFSVLAPVKARGEPPRAGLGLLESGTCGSQLTSGLGQVNVFLLRRGVAVRPVSAGCITVGFKVAAQTRKGVGRCIEVGDLRKSRLSLAAIFDLCEPSAERSVDGFGQLKIQLY